MVHNCENLKKIPEYLGKHLLKLDIERVRDTVVESARKIEETKKEGKGKFAVQFELKIGAVCEANKLATSH